MSAWCGDEEVAMWTIKVIGLLSRVVSFSCWNAVNEKNQVRELPYGLGSCSFLGGHDKFIDVPARGTRDD